MIPRAAIGQFVRAHRSQLVWAALLVVLIMTGTIVLRAATQPTSIVGRTTLLDGRPCQSAGTVFADLTTPEDLTKTFDDDVARVVQERVTLMADPSAWSCVPGADASLPMPALTAMADALPGWKQQVRNIGGGFSLAARPVTQGAFASVLAEYLRAYECRLLEVQQSSLSVVAHNEDRQGTFCCRDGACVDAAGGRCTTPASADPTCGDTCPLAPLVSDFIQRPTALFDRLQAERARARVAIERTLLTLSSFERRWSMSHDLQCLARASLDLEAEMNLLASTTSCMPRVWDAVTSLHDRTPRSAP